MKSVFKSLGPTLPFTDRRRIGIFHYLPLKKGFLIKMVSFLSEPTEIIVTFVCINSSILRI
jgi:hypothetical protein